MSFIYMKAAQRAICVLALMVSGQSLAQSVVIPDENTTFPEGINPKPAVVSQCMGCHGAQGISQFPDWPNLAGLSKDYITAELQKFKEGQRKNAMMHTVTQEMSEQDVSQVAAYFSKQQLAINVTTDLARPKGMETCIACHGDGSAKNSGIGPNIIGQQEGYLLKQIDAFRNGQRNNEIMTNIIKNVSPEDMRKIVQYYSRINIHVNSENGEK